jgi:HAD superfamily phosphatase (TIGR01668 family)
MTWRNSIDLLDTFIQYLMKMKDVDFKKHLLADCFVGSVNEITPEFLEERGIEGVIWDVDGTLMGYHATEIDSSIKSAYNALSDVKQVVLSNCGEQRFLELGQILQEIPVLRMYENRSTGEIGERKLFDGGSKLFIDHSSSGSYNGFGNISSYNGKKPIVLNGYRAIKKPDTRLIEYAMREMGIEDHAKVAMVGDKAITDIVGGNMAGVYTIQVFPPLRADMDRWLVNCIQRPFEDKKVLKYLREAGRDKDITRLLNYRIQHRGGCI